jgi:hypothetical protein
MKEWIYKATKSKVGHDETHRLAVGHKFLCRSASNGSGSAARVSEVCIGDVIHFYYADGAGKDPAPLGSFVVTDGAKYPDRFGARVEGTALFTVRATPENEKMVALLSAEPDHEKATGYAHDPKQDCFTGWVIERLPQAEKSPPKFNQAKLLPGPMQTLWHYPDPDLINKK